MHDKIKTNLKLDLYFALLCRHFGRYFSSNEKFVRSMTADALTFVQHAVVDEDMYQDNFEGDGFQVIYFEPIYTDFHENQYDAEAELITRIKKFLRENLSDNNPRKKAIFWRVMPRVFEYRAPLRGNKRNDGRFAAHTRLGLFNG